MVKRATKDEIDTPTTLQCSDCVQAKATKVVSRRPPKDPNDTFGRRLFFDLFTLSYSYDGFRYVLLIKDKHTGFIWIYLLVDRTQKTIVTTFIQFVTLLETQYGVKVKFPQHNNDIALQKDWDSWVLDTRRYDEPTAVYTQTQNDNRERSREMISCQTTAIRITTRFLKELWSKIWPTTVYLYNRIPRKATN